ncbi:unnamed protein product, partial [Closterium sp. NIES-53]
MVVVCHAPVSRRLLLPRCSPRLFPVLSLTTPRHSLRQNLHPYLLTFLPPTSPSVPLPGSPLSSPLLSARRISPPLSHLHLPLLFFPLKAFSLSFPVPFPPLVKFWEDTPHK